jgi:hypothetical protein
MRATTYLELDGDSVAVREMDTSDWVTQPDEPRYDVTIGTQWATCVSLTLSRSQVENLRNELELALQR